MGVKLAPSRSNSPLVKAAALLCGEKQEVGNKRFCSLHYGSLVAHWIVCSLKLLVCFTLS